MTVTNRKIVFRIGAGAIAAMVASGPKAALACPVCFGMLEGRMDDAVSTAVLTLLGVTVAVLAGFASFFIYLIRRARAVASAPIGIASAAPTPTRRRVGDPGPAIPSRKHDGGPGAAALERRASHDDATGPIAEGTAS